MTALPTLTGAAPIDVSNDTYQSFTADLDQVITSALDNMPFDFSTMDDLSWQIEYSMAGGVNDDTYDLGVRIVNGATILAAADAGGGFASVATGITSATDITSAITAFAYVNQAAGAAIWNGATIEFDQAWTKSKGGDGANIQIDLAAFTGNYSGNVTRVTLIM